MSQLFLPFMFSENMAQSRLCSDDPSAALSQRTQSLQTQSFEMRSVNALNESASQLAGQLMQGLRAIRRKRSRSLPTLAESPSPRVEQSNQQLELSASSTKSAGRLHVRFERGNNVNDDETPQEDNTDALAPLPAIKYRSQSARVSMQLEEEPALPELIGGTLTDILSRPKYATTLVPKLEACLPSYHRGYDWKLLYSLGQHGCSLHTLLTKVQDEAPTLVVVETARGDVFGGFTTVAWHSATSYYGVGESFVFSNQPRFEFFRWSRWDTMLMLSNDQSIAMGGGGEFAWYMNSDLSCGTSGASTTFKNRCLTSEPDFDIVSVEVWGFTTKR